METFISLARVLFVLTAPAAIFTFLALCAETMGFVDLSRTAGETLAWIFMVCGLTAWLTTGPTLYGHRWQGY